MIDYRLKTFLTLCELKNYTKTAKKLFITQPAVTQQIKYLEKYYGVTLFKYEGKNLILTPAGKELQSFALTLSKDCEKIVQKLSTNKENITYKFGATLTIGQYIMPDIIEYILKENPDTCVSMIVDNTSELLKLLNKGKIDFAIIEGNFNKSQYSYELFSMEDYIGICANNHLYKDNEYTLEDLSKETLILREKGSGTRDVFEQLLYEQNLCIESFNSICEIGSLPAILSLVANNCGISFMYKIAAESYINNNLVSPINIKGLPMKREFNFVWLKNSRFASLYNEFFKICRDFNNKKIPL